METAIVVLGIVVVFVLFMQYRERQAWTDERRQLVDRAIARHTGEVLALDRQANEEPKVATGPREDNHPIGL